MIGRVIGRPIGRLAILLLLAGCAAGQGGFRDAKAPIASTTRFEAARLAGPWHVRARFSPEPASPGPAQVHFFTGPPAGQIAMLQTSGLPVAAAPRGSFGVRQVAPGRFVDAAGREYWLLWVDADWRTAAFGSPDGRFGWILSRAPDGGADRIKAARAVLEWAGYDMSRLRSIP